MNIVSRAKGELDEEHCRPLERYNSSARPETFYHSSAHSETFYPPSSSTGACYPSSASSLPRRSNSRNKCVPQSADNRVYIYR